MATIHVARDGAKLGEFSLEQIREGLRTGQFRPTDLGWEQGLPDWRPLATFVVEKPAAAAPSIEPVPGAPAVSPMITPGATAGAGLPWEHRRQLGFFKAFFDTVILLLTKPGEAFAMMKPEGGMGDPILFAIIGGSAGLIVSLFFQVLMQRLPGLGEGNRGAFDMFGMGWIIGYVVLMPVLLILGIFIASGLLHICLMIVGGANRPFETTLRVVCFCCGAAYLLALVPICGGLVSAVYNIVLECIGLSRAHQTSTGKAVLAVFLPLIVCCGISAVLFFVIMGSSGGELKLPFR